MMNNVTRSKVEEMEQMQETIVAQIRKLVDKHPKIFGNRFIFKGVDFASTTGAEFGKRI